MYKKGCFFCFHLQNDPLVLKLVFVSLITEVPAATWTSFAHSAQNVLSKNPASYFWSRFGEKRNHGNSDEEQATTGKA